MSLGTNISRLRAEHHLSQGDLAESLGVSRQSVSKWETDSSVPDLDKLVKLSQLFGVSLDELVTGDAGPAEAETPTEMSAAPAVQVTIPGRMPGRKIAGAILFCMAFLTFLVLTALGGLLEGMILALPFLVCGMICFLAQRRPGLWCAWAVYLLAYIFCYYGTGLSWTHIFFTFSWEQMGLTPVYTIAAWIQVLVTMALLIGTVRSFRTFSFPPGRRNGIILALAWTCFLANRLSMSPIAHLILNLDGSAVSNGSLMVLVSIVQGIVSLILLAIALTLSVRMLAARRASKR